MTLKSTITAQYGLSTTKKVSELSCFKVKLASAKNRLIFLTRCRTHKVIPTFLRNRCPIRSRCAGQIVKRYQFHLLRETISQTRKEFHRLCDRIKRITTCLQGTLSNHHFDLVTRLNKSTYDAYFVKHKERLRRKFELLKPVSQTRQPRPSLIKSPVLQLQAEPLPEESIDLLSLGTKFAVTPKVVPKMEIIEETEKACLSLERKGKAKEADTLRHEIGNILIKAKNPRSNLTANQKKGLAHLKSKRDEIAIVPFDKGQGFVSIERKKLVEKVEKEFNNVSFDTKDTTQSLQTKTQNKLRELHKQDKIDKETYQKLYLLVSLTPTANPAIKAHKPNKDYPACIITSHIGAPQEKLASHLNELLKPIIEKSVHVCKNLTDFVNEIKQIKVGPNERMVSYDATALFPSVPIGDAKATTTSK